MENEYFSIHSEQSLWLQPRPLWAAETAQDLHVNFPGKWCPIGKTISSKRELQCLWAGQALCKVQLGVMLDTSLIPCQLMWQPASEPGHPLLRNMAQPPMEVIPVLPLASWDFQALGVQHSARVLMHLRTFTFPTVQPEVGDLGLLFCTSD